MEEKKAFVIVIHTHEEKLLARYLQGSGHKTSIHSSDYQFSSPCKQKHVAEIRRRFNG